MAIRVESTVAAVDPASLAEQARAGSTRALGDLYGLYSPALFRLAYRLTGSSDDAEDVVHDVFVALPEALARYEERGRFDAWLRRLAARIALMKLRAGRRRASLQLEPDEAREGQPERDRQVGELQAAVDALPIPLRSVLVLKEIEGYSHSETAELLGISVVTSRVRLMRAMSRLRRALGGKS